jgi:mannose-6-phosphate isomerase
LDAGEAIYLSAGEFHAYIGGVGIELMANSDNVLRGGLTNKYVDVDELLNILKFDPRPVQIITPISMNGEAVYLAPVEEFLLSVINLDYKDPFICSDYRSVEIMILIEGEAEIMDLEGKWLLRLKKGDSILIPSVIPRYRITGCAVIYKATVPV